MPKSNKMRRSKQRDEPICDHFRCITQRASHVHDPQSGLSTLLTVVHYEKNSTSTLRISNRGCHRNSYSEKTVLPRCLAKIVEQTHVTPGVTPHAGRNEGRRVATSASVWGDPTTHTVGCHDVGETMELLPLLLDRPGRSRGAGSSQQARCGARGGKACLRPVHCEFKMSFPLNSFVRSELMYRTANLVARFVVFLRSD
jgi:hypothetical protein